MAKDKENVQQESVAQQPQAPQPRPCPQDCRLCGGNQQLFCTTKMLFELSRSQQALHDRIKELTDTVGTLRDQMKQQEQAGAELAIPFAK